jgi:uncharacterized protein (TIGR02265 family)
MNSETTIHRSLISGKPSLPAQQQLSYEATFEALFLRAFANISPAMNRELLAMGLDLTKLKAAYPYSHFVQSLQIIANHLFANEPVEISVPKIGERLVSSYFETTIGKPLLMISRMLGPVRTLHRMRANFRATNNFSESMFVELDGRHFQIWLNEPGLAGLSTLGVLRKGLILAGATKVSVQILSTDALGTVYDIQV